MVGEDKSQWIDELEREVFKTPSHKWEMPIPVHTEDPLSAQLDIPTRHEYLEVKQAFTYALIAITKYTQEISTRIALYPTSTIAEDIRQMRETIRAMGAKKSILIASLHDSRFKLKESISVFLENDGHQFIAYAPDLDIYGCGDLEYEALEDLRTSIVELYFDFKKEKLAPSLQKIWDYLSSIIEEK